MLSLDLDLQPFFDQLNTFLPIFLNLFAVVGGISAAMVLSKTIIEAIVSAFSRGF